MYHLEKAAQAATAAANDYSQAARRATWRAAGVALLVNVVLVVARLMAARPLRPAR